MATIDIYNLSGAKVGTFDLADEIFGAVNEDLLWEAVKHYRAGQHRGTHATKARWQVSGSGKKLWKQKGTGRARIGSIRSPLWRHGGTVHGPVPRSYDYAFPRKKLLGALRSALASKFADGKLTVVNAFDVKEPKTKEFRAALEALKVESTVLIVEAPNAANRNLELSARNIEGLELIPGNEVHPYHLLRYDRVIFSHPAIEKLQLTLKDTLPKRQRKAAKEKTKARRRRRLLRGSACGMKKRRRWPDEIRIPDHSPSGDHRKRFGDQGKPEHAGLPGGSGSDEDGSEAGGADDFQSQSAFRPHGDVSGKRAAAREVCRLSTRLEEGVCTAAGGREDAGVRAEFVRQQKAGSSGSLREPSDKVSRL